jgi:hypothetical protein
MKIARQTVITTGWTINVKIKTGTSTRRASVSVVSARVLVVTRVASGLLLVDIGSPLSIDA